MPPPPGSVQAAHELRRSLAETTDTLGVLNRTAETLLARVPADVWCGVVVDPATLLDTGGEHQHGFPAEVMPRLFEIEHAEQDDVDSLRSLVRRPAATSLLSASTGGSPESSRYYREILAPLRLADELRVLLREGGRTWGLLVMCRSRRSPGFTEQEVRVAASLAVPATAALRRSLLVGGIDNGQVADAPGVITVDDEHTVVTTSPTARRWLDELAETHPPGRLPHTVSALVTHARTRPPGTVSTSRGRTRSGAWVTLHAWRDIGTAGKSGGTTISIGRSQPGELVALILDAYALTPREREVTQQVLLGRSTTEIATALHLSTHTVQDHLKAIFDKTGVRSRRDLVADVFFRHYLPQLAGPSLTTDGRLRRRSTTPGSGVGPRTPGEPV
ncbi:helix-turn-helix transcriptional regulator [Plantactinospora sp. B5E13]|uniref:helix-turn-helix transcriptional regulator n=1 Tax=unclassified Plantactinospora TaxID=2631981 RepID=UPI00325F24FD